MEQNSFSHVTRCKRSRERQHKGSAKSIGMAVPKWTPLGTTIARPIPEKTSFNRWVIAIVILVIVVVGVLFTLIYQSSAIVTTKNFSYSTAPTSQATTHSKSQTSTVR